MRFNFCNNIFVTGKVYIAIAIFSLVSAEIWPGWFHHLQGKPKQCPVLTGIQVLIKVKSGDKLCFLAGWTTPGHPMVDLTQIKL